MKKDTQCHKSKTNVEKKRKVTESMKKNIAGKQRYLCANNPDVVLIGLENYECPLWRQYDNEKTRPVGSFDESGYEIDHIIEYSINQDDGENNLQALCLSCHSVKTKGFMRKRKDKIDDKKYVVKNPEIMTEHGKALMKIIGQENIIEYIITNSCKMHDIPCVLQSEYICKEIMMMCINEIKCVPEIYLTEIVCICVIKKHGYEILKPIPEKKITPLICIEAIK